MKSGKILPYVFLVLGSLMALTGAAFVGMYILEAIVARAGEPDQSLLFWYLPILFMGLIGMVMGLGLGVWGAIRLRKIRRQIPLSDAQHDAAADPKGTAEL